LVGFERKARDAALLRKLYPDLYQGYTSRQADYTSDSGTVKTTVTQIHRFSGEDAIVLEGTVQNETNHPIEFDGLRPQYKSPTKFIRPSSPIAFGQFRPARQSQSLS
jgi:hypothetical protein